MGTVFSFDVRAPGVDGVALDAVIALAALGRRDVLDLPAPTVRSAGSAAVS